MLYHTMIHPAWLFMWTRGNCGSGIEVAFCQACCFAGQGNDEDGLIKWIQVNHGYKPQFVTGLREPVSQRERTDWRTPTKRDGPDSAFLSGSPSPSTASASGGSEQCHAIHVHTFQIFDGSSHTVYAPSHAISHGTWDLSRNTHEMFYGIYFGILHRMLCGVLFLAKQWILQEISWNTPWQSQNLEKKTHTCQ